MARQLASDRGLRRLHELDNVDVEPSAPTPRTAHVAGDEAAPTPLRPAVQPATALLAPAQSFARRIVEVGQGAPTLALSVCEGDDDEGFALAAARALSRDGRAILVAMDESARMPTSGRAGLAELLSGRASFHETIHRDPISRLHALGAGTGAAGGADGLLSALDALLEAYDFVLVAASGALDVDQAFALSQVTGVVAVHAADPHSAAALAEALEDSGLPRPTIVGSDDLRMDQTAA